MLQSHFIRYFGLPGIKILEIKKSPQGFVILGHGLSDFEYSPCCASKSQTVYDHRWVEIKDEPVRGNQVFLRIKKKRFKCSQCQKPFTQWIDGIKKYSRLTERFKKAVFRACEKYSNLKEVREDFVCSTRTVYKIYYSQLELKSRELQYPWPRVIGIDEHKWAKRNGIPCFATMITDHKNERVFELVDGKSSADLNFALMHVPGRENVNWVSLDLCDPFKNFVRQNFPYANIVADKFHVLRLTTPSINKRRKAIAGDRRKNPVGRLLLKNYHELDYFKRKALLQWLKEHPELEELYHFKEAIHGFYRIRGFNRAKRAFIKLTDRMARSSLPEIKTLRKTFMRWRHEILNYFKFRLTNARTEGFNNVAKTVQKSAYGFKSITNYRLRVLHACR